MYESDFWQLIDGAREDSRGDPVEQADVLVESLVGRTPDEVADFARLFEVRLARAFTWNLRAAAAVLLDSADDDDFEAFRCWLIGQGRAVYEGAVDDPDTLAGLLRDFDDEVDGDGEDLGFAADEAYERLTGQELPDLGLPPEPDQPEGVPLDLRDPQALANRVPRVWERFC